MSNDLITWFSRLVIAMIILPACTASAVSSSAPNLSQYDGDVDAGILLRGDGPVEAAIICSCPLVGSATFFLPDTSAQVLGITTDGFCAVEYNKGNQDVTINPTGAATCVIRASLADGSTLVATVSFQPLEGCCSGYGSPTTISNFGYQDGGP